MSEFVRQPPLFVDPQPSHKELEWTPTLDNDYALALISLNRIKGLGRIGIKALAEHLDHKLQNVWECDQDVIEGILTRKKVRSAEAIAQQIKHDRSILIDGAQRQLDSYVENRIAILPFSSLPDSLKTLPEPPSWLFVQGNPSLLFASNCIAVVGTRKPTPKGLRATSTIVAKMSPYQTTLVSGLAEGIDQAAHTASLRAGIPNIAFLGNGIEVVFPKETKELRDKVIAKGGAVASEYLPHEVYQRHFFVERNRLQAAISKLVIPVEGDVQSGTAHTVRFAIEYGRKLCGVKWTTSSSIAELLATKGYDVIDIESSADHRKLDRLIQTVVTEAGYTADPLKNLFQSYLLEIRSRHVTKRSVQAFLAAVKDAASQLEDT